MLLAEPQSTPADFHFHIGRIPVRVTGWFWPAAGLFGEIAGETKHDTAGEIRPMP